MFAKNVYESNLAFLGDFNFDILLTVPDELGVLFQARWTQTKLPRIFFNALWEFLSNSGQKAFMSQKQTRKKCRPSPLESIKTIVASQVKTIVTTLPSPRRDPDQSTAKASTPAACTTANHHIHRPKTSGKQSQKQTRKKCRPSPLESIKTIVASQVKTIVTTLPSPRRDPDQSTAKASTPAACTTANHHIHRPKTSGKQSQKQTRKKRRPSPLESIKTIVTSQVKTIVTALPTPRRDPDQSTAKASKPAACATANHHIHRPKTSGKQTKKCRPSPLESIKTIVTSQGNPNNCKEPSNCPNTTLLKLLGVLPLSEGHQPPALRQTTTYTGPKRVENKAKNKPEKSAARHLWNP